MLLRRALSALAAASVLAASSSVCHAADPVSPAPVATASANDSPPVVIWPTLTPAGDGASKVPVHKPTNTEKDKESAAIFTRAQELDATLRDAVQDLGFTLFVADVGPSVGATRDSDLIERAAKSGPGGSSNAGTWVVSPRIEAQGDGFIVRIVVVPPNGRELRVRVETVTGDAIAVRGLVMLRDLLSPITAATAQIERDRDRTVDHAGFGVMGPLRSQGRAVLGINAALFGGFVAYSVQRASGSDDPRILYPLLTLGTGVGIGAALLAAEEWDVTTGNAWYLSAGAWWGVTSGLFLASGRNIQPLSDRFAWGVGGGFLGLGLATASLVRYKMDEGGAALAHSGGAVGLGLGGLTELLLRGTLDVTPGEGMGYGSAIGLVAAGALATRVKTSPSRVLLVDLGVGLGALVGAAVGSPFVFERVTEGKTRAFLTATLAGSVVGGGVSFFLTRNLDKVPSMALRGSPIVGVIGSSATPHGAQPAYGFGWHGDF